MKLKIEYYKTGDLVPYAGNARTHSAEQIQQIKASITAFGFVVPVIIDDNRVIIAGHGRFVAATELGMPEVPVVVLRHLTEQQRQALTLADNKIAMNGGWDLEKLSEALNALAEEDFDLDLTGFSDSEIDSLLSDDFSVLPEELGIPLIHPKASGEGPLPSVDESAELERVEPKATHDEYAKFDVVMRHENKVRLVECLNKIRDEYKFERIEDAVMELVTFWEKHS